MPCVVEHQLARAQEERHPCETGHLLLRALPHLGRPWSCERADRVEQVGRYLVRRKGRREGRLVEDESVGIAVGEED